MSLECAGAPQRLILILLSSVSLWYNSSGGRRAQSTRCVSILRKGQMGSHWLMLYSCLRGCARFVLAGCCVRVGGVVPDLYWLDAIFVLAWLYQTRTGWMLCSCCLYQTREVWFVVTYVDQCKLRINLIIKLVQKLFANFRPCCHRAAPDISQFAVYSRSTVSLFLQDCHILLFLDNTNESYDLYAHDNLITFISDNSLFTILTTIYLHVHFYVT